MIQSSDECVCPPVSVNYPMPGQNETQLNHKLNTSQVRALLLTCYTRSTKNRIIQDAWCDYHIYDLEFMRGRIGDNISILSSVWCPVSDVLCLMSGVFYVWCLVSYVWCVQLREQLEAAAGWSQVGNFRGKPQHQLVTTEQVLETLTGPTHWQQDITLDWSRILT